MKHNYCRVNIKTNEIEWIMFNDTHWEEMGYSKYSIDKTLSHMDMLILVDKWNRASRYSKNVPQFFYHL